MKSDPLIEWPQPFFELASFVAAFLSAGAVGFRYSALRDALKSAPVAPAEERRVVEAAGTRAAWIGLTGALIAAVLLAQRLPAMAERRHVTVLQLVTGAAPVATQIALILLAVAGFALARGRRAAGWPLAAAGVVAGAVRAAFFGQWERLINPLHVLAGGLWIGTLFVLVIAGLPAVLASPLPSARRGTMAAAMVNAFSPLALRAAMFVALFGMITAWRHLPRLADLWTTPYGYALITKLCVVSVVAGIGAHNWRVLRPRLGTEDAALTLRRSARRELLTAAVVLAITAILVSLPSPKPPGP